MQRRATNTSRVREWFLSHPWQWVDTRTLELLGGRNAWRTRVSNARVRLRKENLGDIKNRQRRDADNVVFSEYRYEPLLLTTATTTTTDRVYVDTDRGVGVIASGRLF